MSATRRFLTLAVAGVLLSASALTATGCATYGTDAGAGPPITPSTATVSPASLGHSGDAKAQFHLNGPGGLDLYPAAAGGGYVFVDGARILWAKPDGNVYVLVGRDPTDTSAGRHPVPHGPGIPGREVKLNLPHDVAALGDGSLLIADTANNQILYYNRTNGLVTVAAGNGNQCVEVGRSDGDPTYKLPACGSGHNALDVPINWPDAVSVNPGGGFFVVTGDGQVTCTTGGSCSSRAKPGPSTVTLVTGGNAIQWAGTGYTGSRGTATGPAAALSTPLDAPSDAAVNPVDGKLYIADANNCKIMRMTGSNVETFAGAGAGACNHRGNTNPNCIGGPAVAPCWMSSQPTSTLGDNGPPLSARFSGFGYFGFGVNGEVLISDFFNCRIRSISSLVVRTIIGTGECGYNTETDPLKAQVFWANGLARYKSDNGKSTYTLVADPGGRRVRILTETESTTTARRARALEGKAITPEIERQIMKTAKPVVPYATFSDPNASAPKAAVPGPRPLLTAETARRGGGHLRIPVLCPVDPNGRDCVGHLRVNDASGAAVSATVTVPRTAAGRQVTVSVPVRSAARVGAYVTVHMQTRQPDGRSVAQDLPVRVR